MTHQLANASPRWLSVTVRLTNRTAECAPNDSGPSASTQQMRHSLG